MKNILDAGPLIAALNRRDQYHRWACEVLAKLGPPFYSCPEAITEAAAMTGQPANIVQMIESAEIVLGFDLSKQTAGVFSLLKKYEDRQIDLADACIIRMTELIPNSRVITLDRTDFEVYRRNGREIIPIIAPEGTS